MFIIFEFSLVNWIIITILFLIVIGLQDYIDKHVLYHLYVSVTKTRLLCVWYNLLHIFYHLPIFPHFSLSRSYGLFPTGLSHYTKYICELTFAIREPPRTAASSLSHPLCLVFGILLLSLKDRSKNFSFKN